MNTEKIKEITGTFAEGFKDSCKTNRTYELAGVCGIYMGLKYKGSIVRGVATAGVVYVALGALTGTMHCVQKYLR